MRGAVHEAVQFLVGFYQLRSSLLHAVIEFLVHCAQFIMRFFQLAVHHFHLVFLLVEVLKCGSQLFIGRLYLFLLFSQFFHEAVEPSRALRYHFFQLGVDLGKPARSKVKSQVDAGTQQHQNHQPE